MWTHDPRREWAITDLRRASRGLVRCGHSRHPVKPADRLFRPQNLPFTTMPRCCGAAPQSGHLIRLHGRGLLECSHCVIMRCFATALPIVDKRRCPKRSCLGKLARSVNERVPTTVLAVPIKESAYSTLFSALSTAERRSTRRTGFINRMSSGRNPLPCTVASLA